MSVLYLVRHGQASFGMPNYDILSETGEEQARVLASHWVGAGRRFDAVYSGAMKRHRQTAQPLVEAFAGKGLTPERAEINGAFNEFDAAAVWQDQIQKMIAEDPATARDAETIFTDPKAFERLFQRAMLRWVSDDLDPAIKPSWKAFTSRVREGVQQVMESHSGGGSVAVFTSAGPISATLQMALDINDVKAMELSFITLNASVTAFRFTRDKISLMEFNNVSHLGDALVTHR